MDQKLSDLPVAATINGADLSVLVHSGADYQFAFSTLLQFIGSGLAVGAAINFGAVLPQNTSGKNGDVFINTTSGSFAQKTSGIWSVVYSIPSSGGTTDGTVLYGLGAPSNVNGNNNDTYINTGTGIFYKKMGGTWNQVFSMQTGPAGPRGVDGTNGLNGINASTILHGTGNPSNLSTGTDGDFYINTSTYDFFGPKAGGIWPVGSSIIGANGAQGLQGVKGDTGAAGPKGDTGSNGPAGPAGATGPVGATGPTGAAGATGSTGVGVPTGGGSNQVLTKNSTADYDTHWVDQTTGSPIPSVAAGIEKVVTQKNDGAHVDYNIIDLTVPSSALTSADWTIGLASITGFIGQKSYDNDYEYTCIGTNQWRRAALNGTLVDLYLANTNDTAGIKSGTDLNTAFPSAVIGQRTWGNAGYYEKKISNWIYIAGIIV